MSRIQIVKPSATAYNNFYSHTRHATNTATGPASSLTSVPTSVGLPPSVPTPPTKEEKDLLQTLRNELNETKKLNDDLRTELRRVIEFNVALQHDMELLSLPSTQHPRVFTTVPRDDIVLIGPVHMTQGRTYVLESHLTYINIDITNECGTVVGMYEQGNAIHVLGTGAAAWNGRVNADDDSPYGGMHTVLVRGIFTPSETKEYTFELHELGKKHTQLLLNHPTFPCITTIL